MNNRGVSPTRVTVGYVGIASILLFFSLVVPPRLATTVDRLVRLQALTGALGVGLTAGFVFLVVRTQQRTIRRTDEELTEVNRLLGILFRVLRHNLRNDTNVIEGYTQVLREHSDDPEQLECIARIDDAVTDIIDYVTKIQRMAAADTTRVTVELPRVVSHVVDDLRSTHPAATIDTEFGGVGRVRATPDIEAAIAELVENAVRHNDRDAPRVEVELSDAGDWWQVTVSDDGPGIPEHEREVLHRGEETPHVHSSGVGLWFVYWVVTHSDGRIEIADNEPRGTVVTLTLPKARTGPSPVERRMTGLFRQENRGSSGGGIPGVAAAEGEGTDVR